MMTIVRWFISPTVRRAVAMRRHVSKLVAAQRDILSPQAVAAMDTAVATLRNSVGQGTSRPMLLAQMEKLEAEANKWLRPYPHAVWRENVEVLLVALGVAMAIRTFFLQPFKIPTGSMQPTLYGITQENITNKPDAQTPGRLARFVDYWAHGVSYFHEVAPEDGRLMAFKQPVKLLLFNLKQEYQFNSEWHTVWFPVDDLFARVGLAARNGELADRTFLRGEDLFRLKVIAGDHLFVNRITYNFRHPARGEIIVFSTKGFDPEVAISNQVEPVYTNQYYIKRLVALGGERVRIGDDHHLIINGRRLDSSTPHFENIYNFRNNAGENEYFGHVQTKMLSDVSKQFEVQTNHCMVMGDNTRNSLDSRYIGDFSREYIIGKSSFVYWPISSRFGWGYD